MLNPPPSLKNRSSDWYRYVKYGVLAVVLMLGVVLILTTVPFFRDRRNLLPTTESLDSLIASETLAIAELENEESQRAVAAYAALLEDDAENRSFLINSSIARLFYVESLVKLLSDPTKQTDELKTAIPIAIADAKNSLETAKDSLGSDPVLSRLELRLIEQQLLADLGNRSTYLNRSLETGRDAVQRFPGNAPIAKAFNDIYESISITRPELIGEAIAALELAVEKEPRNLYLRSALGQRLLTAERPDAKQFLLETAKIAAPVRWQIQLGNGGDDPQEILDEAFASDSVDDWFVAGQWLNLLAFTDAFKSDERRVDPNTLALIDFDHLQSLIQQRAELRDSNLPIDSNLDANWTIAALGDESRDEAVVQAIECLDWDNDFTTEVVVLDANDVSIFSMANGKERQLIAKAPVAKGSQGLVVAELFKVQSFESTRSDPERISRTVDRLVDERVRFQADADKTNLRQMFIERRPNILREIITFGSGGIQVFGIRPAAETETLTRLPTKDAGLVFTDVTPGTGLEDLRNVSAVVPLDWDSDGDLDLAIVAEGRLTARLNLGNRTFQDHDEWIGQVGAGERILDLRWSDYDRDIDIDLIATFDNGTIGVFENLLHGQFRYSRLEGEWASIAGATRIQPFDLDGNGSTDIVGLHAGQIDSVFTAPPIIDTTLAQFSKPMVSSDARAFAVGDFNNDTYVDLMVATEEGLQLQISGDAFDESTVSSAVLDLPGVTQIEARDVDWDGDLDCVVVSDGRLYLCLNELDSDNGYVAVRLKGIDDNSGAGRVNTYAIGSRLEIYSEGRFQTAQVDGDQTHFGLGDAKSPVNVRIIFPNGVTQNSIEPPAVSVLEEIQFPKGSCPFVYGWDGERWQFITDLLWNAPLGLQYARGKVLPDRRWEYLALPQEWMTPKDNAYEIRITEELWEAAYFDAVRLFTLDLPQDREVFSNEKVGPPEIAQPGIWIFDHLQDVLELQDQQGRNWNDALRATDRIYAVPFDTHIRQGRVNEHVLQGTIPLDSIPESVQLVLNGWIYPSDTSLNIGMDQNPDLPPGQPPSLWLADENGTFDCVMPFMGFPGGKPKTIVVDLTEVLQRAISATENREEITFQIRSNSEIYWDSIQFARAGRLEAIPQQPCALISAELHRRGFSAIQIGPRSMPHGFAYQELDAARQWPAMSGRFTRFGDVQDQLAADDDLQVVMGAGDEMIVRFALPDAPIPTGYKRHFFLHSVGWDKDADLNTVAGQSSLPLPFAGMKTYPAPASQQNRQLDVDSRNAPTLTRQQSYMPMPTTRGEF